MSALITDRVVLRAWREADAAPFAALNADPEVMRYFPSVLTREDSDALIGRIEEQFENHGYGLWAAEERATGAFMGFVGLIKLRDELPFAPGVEIGWRLAKEYWGIGYAPEAARAALAYAFAHVGADEVYSFTAVQNEPSIRVMEKIGMRRVEGGDFDHPLVSEESGLKRHMLYRIGAGDPMTA